MSQLVCKLNYRQLLFWDHLSALVGVVSSQEAVPASGLTERVCLRQRDLWWLFLGESLSPRARPAVTAVITAPLGKTSEWTLMSSRSLVYTHTLYLQTLKTWIKEMKVCSISKWYLFHSFSLEENKGKKCDKLCKKNNPQHIWKYKKRKWNGNSIRV